MAKVLEFPTLTLLLYKFEDETRFGRGKGVEGNHHFQINISKEKFTKLAKISPIFC